QDAGDRRSRRQLGQHEIVAPRIAYPGGICGEAHARNRLQVGKTGGGERGNRGHRRFVSGGAAGDRVDVAYRAGANKSRPKLYVQGKAGGRAGRIDTPAAPAYLSIVAVRSLSYSDISLPRSSC